jgi:hypothetical protein
MERVAAMTITDNLQPGDVVELRFPSGTTIRGPLVEEVTNRLGIADAGWDITSRGLTGPQPYWVGRADLLVVSRAPRALYVNHDRTKPVPGDVVRDADSDSDPRTWVRNAEGFSNEWMTTRAHFYVPRENLPDRLRLLVDGETGQVVA